MRLFVAARPLRLNPGRGPLELGDSRPKDSSIPTPRFLLQKLSFLRYATKAESGTTYSILHVARAGTNLVNHPQDPAGIFRTVLLEVFCRLAFEHKRRR